MQKRKHGFTVREKETFGYVRISMKDQNADRQLIAMEPCHIPSGNLFIDKKSGKGFNRPYMVNRE